jgi:hypothetical protein
MQGESMSKRSDRKIEELADRIAENLAARGPVPMEVTFSAADRRVFDSIRHAITLTIK